MFEPIVLMWRDVKKTIPANNVMKAIATIEDVVTLFELQQMFAKEAPKLSSLVSAYGALLRFAGFTVTDEQVWTDVFSSGEIGMTKLMEALSAILLMMRPKKLSVSSVADAKKKSRGVARISRKRTSSR